MGRVWRASTIIVEAEDMALLLRQHFALYTSYSVASVYMLPGYRLCFYILYTRTNSIVWKKKVRVSIG